MSRVIVLDTGPLGLVTNPKLSSESAACAQWLQAHIATGNRIIIPEIADYELRRELLRANKTKGIARLEELAKLLEYLPITTTAMRQAAKFWAQARQQGQPTAGDKTIDGDMILVAQAVTLAVPNLVIATTNVGHLAKFVAAELWQNITPRRSPSNTSLVRTVQRLTVRVQACLSPHNFTVIPEPTRPLKLLVFSRD